MDFEALNFVPIPIVVLEQTDQNTFVYFWMNKAAVIFSGLQLEAISGKTPREVFPGRAGEQLAARQEAAARNRTTSNYLYPLRVPRGEVWIETSLVPVLRPDGTVHRLIATMQDRTKERALQEQSIQSEVQLKSVEAEIENYISMAAHDLRTPMLQVQEIVSLLREDFVDHGDGKLDLLEMLDDVGLKASDLIQQVLSVAKASTTEVDCSVVDLAQLASDIFAVLDPQKSYDLTADGVVLETDVVALQIALRNLTDNAIKHCGAGQIAVHLGFYGEHNGMLTFQVRDNGRGFDDPAVAFLDGGEFRYESGYGMLGVKRVIAARGGEISAVRPQDGTGACIRFSLPGRVTHHEPGVSQLGSVASDHADIGVSAAE